MSRRSWWARPASPSRICLPEPWWELSPAVCLSPPCITKTAKKSCICWWSIRTSPPAQSSIDCPLIGLKKPLVHQSVHQFTDAEKNVRLNFSLAEVILRGCFFENYIFRYETRWEITGSYFLRSLRLLNRCSGRFFVFWNRHKKFFWKSVGISQKIRQRESEKAKSLPGTLRISYTFIRYIPWPNSQMNVSHRFTLSCRWLLFFRQEQPTKGFRQRNLWKEALVMLYGWLCHMYWRRLGKF